MADIISNALEPTYFGILCLLDFALLIRKLRTYAYAVVGSSGMLLSIESNSILILE